MARPDPRKIKDEAAEHVTRARWRKALDCYRALEKLEPREPTWPQRSGEMLRRLALPAEATEALGRAADLYNAQGFLLRAVAVCKLILEIDPRRRDVEEKLAALHAARMATQRRAGFVTVPVAPPDAPGEPPPPSDAPPPLAQVALNRVVPGSRKSDQIPSRPGSAVYEIPLDEMPAAEKASVEESVRALFPRTPLFSSLDEAKLRLLIARVGLKRLAPGEILFHRGDPGDALFVIAGGEVAVTAPGPGGADVELGRMSDGAFFGEIALLVDQVRTATITATSETDLLVIDRATVAELIRGAPEVLQILLRFMRDRLVESLIERSPLFTPFQGEDRRALARRFQFMEAEPGSLLCEQGARVAGLFVILAGQADVVLEGRPTAQIGHGDIFGETAVLSGQPALASVVARGKVLLLGLARADVLEIIMTHPRVLEHLANVAEAHQRQIHRWKQV